MINVKKGEQAVSQADYNRALHAIYRVWMLEPRGDAAQLVEYEMDQEALEEFLEDYTRFAELLVRIEALEPAASAEDSTPAVQN